MLQLFSMIKSEDGIKRRGDFFWSVVDFSFEKDTIGHIFTGQYYGLQYEVGNPRPVLGDVFIICLVFDVLLLFALSGCNILHRSFYFIFPLSGTLQILTVYGIFFHFPLHEIIMI